MSQFFSKATAASLGTVQTLTGDAGGAISPDGAGNITVTGGTLITTTGAGNAITWDLDNGTDGQVIIGSTAGSPAYANITSSGSTVTISNGSNTINLETGGAVSTSFPTDGGTATPAVGALTVAGGTLVTTAGAGSTVTVNLDNGTNGQIIIGATAGSPAYGNITSTSGELTVTEGPNTLDLSFTVPIDVDSGGTGALTLTDHGVLVGSGTAAITALAVGTNGQVLLGSTGADPVFATLTSSGGTIAFTPGAGTLNLESTATGSVSWSVETGATKAMAVSEAYFSNRAGGTLAFTLPASAAVGDTMEICQMQAGQGWSLAQNAGQTCYIGNTNTTTGVGGSLASTDNGDWIEIVCRVADTDFAVNVKSGNITVV